jgi:hypothetical protein
MCETARSVIKGVPNTHTLSPASESELAFEDDARRAVTDRLPPNNRGPVKFVWKGVVSTMFQQQLGETGWVLGPMLRRTSPLMCRFLRRRWLPAVEHPASICRIADPTAPFPLCPRYRISVSQ